MNNTNYGDCIDFWIQSEESNTVTFFNPKHFCSQKLPVILEKLYGSENFYYKNFDRRYWELLFVRNAHILVLKYVQKPDDLRGNSFKFINDILSTKKVWKNHASMINILKTNESLLLSKDYRFLYILKIFMMYGAEFHKQVELQVNKYFCSPNNSLLAGNFNRIDLAVEEFIKELKISLNRRIICKSQKI